MQGWIKLYRKLVDWEWYTNTNVKSLFIHLLIRANHSDTRWMGTVVKEGSFVTSVASLANETGLSVQQVRAGLKKLEATGEINKQTTNKNTLIILLNYAKYQDLDDSENGDTQQTTNKQPTNNQQTNNKQTTTNKNDKNDNNIKNEENEKNIYVQSSNEDCCATEQSGQAKTDLSYADIQQAYNNICADLPKCRIVTDARKNQIRLCKNILKNADMDFKTYFQKIQNSDFLTGRGKSKNDWQADFDWIFKTRNCTRIIEGVYDNKGGAFCEY